MSEEELHWLTVRLERGPEKDRTLVYERTVLIVSPQLAMFWVWVTDGEQLIISEWRR